MRGANNESTSAMSREWRWEGAVVAISAGDKYYEAVSTEGDVLREVYRLGDCARLCNERGREMLAIVTALWEARDGGKHVEVRQLFTELSLVRQLQETAKEDLPVLTTALVGGAEKVWESNHLEVVPLTWINSKIDAKDVLELASSEGGAAFVVVGFFDVHTDRLQRLPSTTTRCERSRQLSTRVRDVLSDANDTATVLALVGQKRPRDAASSPETEAAIAKMRMACQELLLSHAPDQTTAREDEFDAIYGVLGMAIRTGASSGALYVSGLPGTGKTTLVREVVRELKKECEHDGLPPFLYLEINGLHLPKPENAYEAIWKAVTGESVVPRALTPARICKTLASEYEHGDPRRRPMILLVLDEMDFLVTGKSVVLYNILEWQAFAQSKLIVVGIANTMDLPERLEQKVRSRLGTNRLIFSSYTASQLERIVRQRLAKQLSILSADAIQICCKYVAHASGDARQALTLCRRAVEVALERLTHGTGDGRAVVTSEDMQTAQAATSVSAPLIRLRDCRKFECVFLIALRMEIKRTDKEDASFESVLDRFAVLCNTHSLTPVPRLRDLLLLCDELSRSGILRQNKTKSSRYPKLTLRCSPQEIYDVFLAHPIGRQLLN